jgi:tRNA A-37 threonylcarbamoyl transferase component Bud32
VTGPDPELVAFLREAGIAAPGEQGSWTALAGGVSSDIWRVELDSGTVCVKRALAQLKVAAEWKAPVERNSFEWEYMQLAERIAPGAVPRPLAHDPHRGMFAMAWLAPDQHRLWKTELLAGRVDPIAAASVGDLIGRIHAATARDPAIPGRFATDESFHALRIEPYLLATAERHPGLGARLHAIAHATAHTKRALVHGDVSPKNILLGPDGPVLLDAECAWYGDPAFDLAFCLNHLAVKARVVPGAHTAISRAFDDLLGAYLGRVDWEAVADLEARAAALLPALALARVDGKSPLEYLDEPQRAALRSAARATILEAPTTVAAAKGCLVLTRAARATRTRA